MLHAPRFDQDDALGHVPLQGLVDHVDAVDRVRGQEVQHRTGAQDDGQSIVERPRPVSGLAVDGHGLDLRGEGGVPADAGERIDAARGHQEDQRQQGGLERRRLEREPDR
jgi:hypothetical protein